MEKTITLTSDEICIITLAIRDKITSLKKSVAILGENLTPMAQARIDSLKEVASKINGWNN